MNNKLKKKAFLLTLVFYAGFIALLFSFAFPIPTKVIEEQYVEISAPTGGGGGGGGSDNYEPVSDNNMIASNATSGDNNEDIATDPHSDANYSAGQTSSGKENEIKTAEIDKRITNHVWGKGTGSGGGNGSGTGSGSGTGTGTGSGSGNGSGYGPGDGPGSGPGSGGGYTLVGRGAKNIPKPAYISDEQGKVVVTIWVNRDGVVTRAEPGAIGTTISDASVWKECKDKALKAKFTAKKDAAEIQKGTITYYFIKQN
jgi:hypothetical protein